MAGGAEKGVERSGSRAVEDLFASRGFKAGSCYRHPAVRRCAPRGRGLRCDLEVFPYSLGAIHLPLDPATQALIPGKPTTDYGIFVWQMRGPERKAPPRLEIRSIERVPLERWDGIQDPTPLARSVPCGAKAER